MMRGRAPGCFIASLACLACLCCGIPAQAQNVIVVVIDGARYTETIGAGSAYVPHLWNDLKPQGTLYTSFRIGSPGKTETVPGHATVVTGTWQQVSNDINGVPTRPTVFEYFRQENGHPQQACYLVAGKSKLAAIAYSNYAGYGVSYGASVSAGNLSDDQVYSNLVSVMDTYHPGLIVVNLPGVDAAGHSGNWANYLTAITHADLLVHQLWQKIQSDSYYRPGNTTLLVTNDHGRHDDAHGGFQNHGDDCEGCRRIMLLAVGRGVAPDQVEPAARYQIDIAPTIANLLNFTAVYADGTNLLDAPPPLPPSDFTGDLKSDLLWRGTGGDVWQWPMNGATRGTETYGGTVSDLNWQIRSLGDQTGDGKADILWRHTVTGALYLWPGGVQSAELYVATVPAAYQIVATGDYDGDGKADLLWRHVTQGDLWLWKMNGATRATETYVGTVDPAYVLRGSGDLDGDRKADLVWQHASQGDAWVWLMNGATRLSETYVTTVGDPAYQVKGVADFTGDTKADILWRHATQGDVWLWTMQGATRQTETYVATVDPAYDIAAAGDYDGDGKADLLWRHATQGDLWLWLMNGAARLSESWVATVPDVGYQVIR